jgi:serine/threonine-protein kinase HipA
MADELAIWLYGERVAIVERHRGRPRLTYTPEALARYQLGTPLLSLALPVSDRRYPQGLARSFLEGLLPEGESRRAIARGVGVRSEDMFALLRELGRDCAGAIVVQPLDDPSPPAATTRTAQALGESELAELVGNLRSAPLGAGGRVRVSLAGVQEKLLLTRMPDGGWGRPVDGAPSTHILKPEIATYPHTVENEAFCMRVARHLGLGAAFVEIAVVAERKLIVVERYDRDVSADGTVQRIHQEDLCQALGVLPEIKYEEDGGPSLRQIADVLQSVAPPESLETLLKATTLNVLLGNGDAHGKNFSLLHSSSGALTLAPLYDLLCTLHYGDTRLAMYVDDVQRAERVTSERLINEAASWGVSRERARATIESLLGGAPRAMALAREETPGLPTEFFANVEGQLRRLLSAG